MRIVCPQCGYSRDIPSDKVPSRSSIATCPKCQSRFRFRGSPHPSGPVEGVDEPVYPPRPSRPQARYEPAGGQPPVFEARSSRLYQPDPDPGPEMYGHVPPRPQARWLPDPEPGASPPRPRPARPQPRFEDTEPAASAEAQPVFRPEFAEGAAAPWERRPDLGRPDPRPGVRQPEEAPLDFPDEKPAPWERMGASVAHPGPLEQGFDRHGFEDEPVIERPPQAGHLRGEQPSQPEAAADAPVYDQPAAHPDGEEMYGEHANPSAAWASAAEASEAVAGEDSVRDIWARLQAMGGEARQSPLAPDGPAGERDAPRERAVPIGSDTLAPWEQLEHYGVIPAFMATAKNIFLKPGDFFDHLPPVTGRVRPLLFAMVVCLAAMVAGLVWNYFGMGPNLSELGRTDGFQGLGAGAVGGLALLGLAPLVLVAFAFLDASLTHLLLGLLRSASRPFEDTFRTLCYAGAPWLLAILPLPYSYLIPVVLIWHMTLQAIGLKKLHQSGYPQVLASVLVKWSLYFMASFAILHVLITRR